jgi:hypothetical protein
MMDALKVVPMRLEDLQEILEVNNHMNFTDKLGRPWILKAYSMFYKIEPQDGGDEIFLFEPLEAAILFMLMMCCDFNR